MVKVIQWKRRCLENYLIDEKIIYDLLNDTEISKDRIEARGKVQAVFKEIAVSQLKEAVATDKYNEMAFENAGLRPREIIGKSYADMSDILFSRLQTMKSQICMLSETDWKSAFVSACEEEHSRRQAQWDSDWLTLCDGKRFFRELHQLYGVKVSPIKLKKMVVERMQREQTDAWVLIEKILADALKIG